VGVAFDLYCSDTTGAIAHKVNSGVTGPPVIVSSTSPDTTDRLGGELWWDSTASILHLLYIDIDGARWVRVNGSEDGSLLLEHIPTPLAPDEGFSKIYFKSDLRAYYLSENNEEKTLNGITVSDQAPHYPSQGDLWIDSTDGAMYNYYQTSWVQFIPYESTPVVSEGLIFDGGDAETDNTGFYTVTLDFGGA